MTLAVTGVLIGLLWSITALLLIAEHFRDKNREQQQRIETALDDTVCQQVNYTRRRMTEIQWPKDSGRP